MDNDALAAAIRCLPMRPRIVVQMRFLDGEREHTIARWLGMTTREVRGEIVAALDALRPVLGAETPVYQVPPAGDDE